MKLDKDNSILCVWPATVVEPDEADNFNEWLADEFGVTGEYVEGIETLPDGEPGSGGRIDTLFRVASDDISKFAVPRLNCGIRWYSDYVNNSRHIVPDDIIERYAEDE